MERSAALVWAAVAPPAEPDLDPGTLPPIQVCRLGLVPYRDGVAIQEQLRARRQAEEIPDTLLLLEHPPVYTRGRRAKDDELSLGEDFYRAQGIEIVQTNRGGRVTYHGPGQLVGYPIMRVKDVLAHLRLMESAIVDALAKEGVEARSRCDEGPDWTGVWVGPGKIASLGVHVSREVSAHGFAVNVDNDLTPFSWVVPCGLGGVSMTSIAAELEAGVAAQDAACDPAGGARRDPGALTSEKADLDRFAQRMARSFCAIYGRKAVEVSPRELGIDVVDGEPLRAAA